MTNNWENVIWNEGVIYAGTHSRGVYKTNAFAAPTVSINENKVNVTNQTALRVFPNPVRNNANIQVELSSKLNDAVISIYDLKGSVVKTMKLNQLNEGNNLQQIPVNGLNKGMYIIQLTGSGINVSTRMLIAE
jgi:flagellar hook assembly protein FlgD